VAATIAVPIVLWLLIWAIGAITGRHTIASLDAMTSDKKHDKYGNVVPEGKIDTVVFDIGNVLTDFAWEEFLYSKGYDKAMVERMGKASVRSEDWAEFDLGNLTTDQITDKFAENDPEIADELKRAFSDVTGILKKRDASIPWIRALQAAGYKVLVLSNYSLMAHETCQEALEFLNYVDGGILSYKEHIIKPDPAIYKLLEDRYDLVPDRIVFIDDTPVNIQAAKERGWKGIVYHSYDQVVQELHNLGVRY
jgi:epoxide hydrolase-like predicted phosphatase